MRICLVYDCLFPWTIGGAERWYRNLGERLAVAGHEVTYLTLTQWDAPPTIEGVRIVSVGPRMPLYRKGKRRILPPLRFGWGVFLHLLRNGKHYDVVHTASFPFFSLLAAGICRPFKKYRIICDWHEVWSAAYWRDYLGPLGWIGNAVQRLCARVPQSAYTFSRLYADRLRTLGLKNVTRLTGEYAGQPNGPIVPQAKAPPTVIYAGRFIPEKRIDLLVDALAIAVGRAPEIRAVLFGDGPDREAILRRIADLGLKNTVDVPGFVDAAVIDVAMREGLCVVQPSSREGYGMIVVEAAARGVPAIAVEGPDNAATELIEDGENGFAVSDPNPELLAAAILRCAAEGGRLRTATVHWYKANEERVSLDHSLKTVVSAYQRPDG